MEDLRNDPELVELRRSRQMLGQIAAHVEDWCDEEMTTLDGVKLVLAELYAMKSDKLYGEIGDK